MSTGSVVLRLEGTSDKLTSVAFSPDGAHLATGGLDQKGTLWDAATGRLLFQLAGHTAAVTAPRCSPGLAFSPDGRRLVTSGGAGDATAKIWDAATGQPQLVLRGHTGTDRVLTSWRTVYDVRQTFDRGPFRINPDRTPRRPQITVTAATASKASPRNR